MALQGTQRNGYIISEIMEISSIPYAELRATLIQDFGKLADSQSNSLPTLKLLGNGIVGVIKTFQRFIDFRSTNGCDLEFDLKLNLISQTCDNLAKFIQENADEVSCQHFECSLSCLCQYLVRSTEGQ